MLKVISFNICPFVQRVTALLAAKNIAYEVEYISIKNKPEWFLDVSPNGQVPVLITETGHSLFESDAIVEYIEEAHPRLNANVSNEERALDRAWSYLASKNYLVQCSAQRSSTKKILDERSLKLRNGFAAIEKALGDTQFFNADSIGMVDIAWLPLLHRAAIIERCSGYDFLKGFPKVKKWQEQILASNLAEKSVSDSFIDDFTHFYLSDDTFLGSNGDACSSKADHSCIANTCC